MPFPRSECNVVDHPFPRPPSSRTSTSTTHLQTHVFFCTENGERIAAGYLVLVRVAVVAGDLVMLAGLREGVTDCGEWGGGGRLARAGNGLRGTRLLGDDGGAPTAAGVDGRRSQRRGGAM